MALGAVGLQQGGGGLDRLQQLLVDLAADRGRFGGGGAVVSGAGLAEAGWALVIGAASIPRSAATPS